MQNVAWPMTIVSSERLIPAKLKAEFSAMPVMMPGSASGSTSSERDGLAAEEAEAVHAERRRRAEHERDRRREQPPALSDSTSAARTCGSFQATVNHFVLSPWIGQLCTFELLNA